MPLIAPQPADSAQIALERVVAGGVAFYRSPLLARVRVPHAFATRVGGVSPAPFDSLNLGLLGAGPQDDLAHLAENRRRLFRACGLAGRGYRSVTQVHGDVVVNADLHLPPGTRGDALVTGDPTAAIGVKTADCCPVLLASASGLAVAAVHAGWRGAVGGVIESAVAALVARGHPAPTLLAAIGPCIGPDAFEVGQEVAEAFWSRFGPSAPVAPPPGEKGKYLIDLPEAACLALRAAGLTTDHIDVGRVCTVAHAGDFFSHRRDNGITGRMLNVIGPRSN